MGNEDLAITINNYTFLILGREYSDNWEAIKKAKIRFDNSIRELKKFADFPEDIDDTIKNIEVRPISMENLTNPKDE